LTVEIGAILEGTVVKMLQYGVIVRLPDGKSGLVHISEIADGYVRDVNDYFREGDAVKVKIVGQKDDGRLELSAKQAEPRQPLEGRVVDTTPPPRGRVSESFDERLSEFIKDSNRVLNELKRSRDARRKGGRR
jgi:S1 RNA binding domain protein